MNLRQVDAFRAVMTTGTTTEAAQLLRTSQPAISRLIRQFEHTTQLRLFELRRGRLVPTPEAKKLLGEIERSYAGLERIKEAVIALRNSGVGRLSIAAVPSLGMSVMPRVVTEFLKTRPGVTISLQTLGSTQVRDGVASGAFDLGFAAQEIDTAGILAQPFVTARTVCVLRKDHPLAKQRVILAGDLAGLPLIMPNRTQLARRRLEQVLAAAGVPPQPVIETTYGVTVCALAAEGAGIGFVNALLASMDITRELVVKPFKPDVLFSFFLLNPLHTLSSRLAGELASAVRSGLRGHAGVRLIAQPAPSL